MMAHKHLHELLQEDQEPFHLKSYIDERRYCQLKRPSNPKTTLQVKKRKPSKHASCFSSFNDSPDVRKSPLFRNFPSPPGGRTQNGAVLLNVPARTAALLLEAAMRIQKQQQQKEKSRTRAQTKNVGFGLFGSILKRLKDRNFKNKKREIENPKSVDMLKRSVSCSCNNSIRLSSAGWSESNEDKSLDLESSCSSMSDESSMVLDAFSSSEKQFCSIPLSPFRFVLQSSNFSGHRTPDFSSREASPSRHKKEDLKQNSDGLNETEAEEQEQCSPVSVLDRPFDEEDDEDGHGHECRDDDEEYEDDYDQDCSYAIVQRAKLQLLDKLRRFERLAEMHPVELEKRMIDQSDEEDFEDQEEEEESQDDDESLPLQRDDHLDTLIYQVLSQSSFQRLRKVPTDMKRLVSDLLAEEKNDAVNDGSSNNEIAVQSVCEKLNSWKEVQSNTIDMMVQMDFVREFNGWKKHQEQVAEIASEIELTMFTLLVEELTQELV